MHRVESNNNKINDDFVVVVDRRWSWWNKKKNYLLQKSINDFSIVAYCFSIEWNTRTKTVFVYKYASHVTVHTFTCCVCSYSAFLAQWTDKRLKKKTFHSISLRFSSYCALAKFKWRNLCKFNFIVSGANFLLTTWKLH